MPGAMEAGQKAASAGEGSLTGAAVRPPLVQAPKPGKQNPAFSLCHPLRASEFCPRRSRAALSKCLSSNLLLNVCTYFILCLARCIRPPQSHLPPEPGGWLQRRQLMGIFFGENPIRVDVEKLPRFRCVVKRQWWRPGVSQITLGIPLGFEPFAHQNSGDRCHQGQPCGGIEGGIRSAVDIE